MSNRCTGLGVIIIIFISVVVWIVGVPQAQVQAIAKGNAYDAGSQQAYDDCLTILKDI
jgi:hypothetical protein